MLKRLILFVFLLGLTVGTGACPAQPPSGPAEIPGPMTLRFPSSVVIDVSTAAGEGGGEFSEIIGMGSERAAGIGEMVDGVLSGLLSPVEVARDQEITNTSTTIPEEAQFFSGEVMKIDFSIFSSPKEETEGCSGSTAGDTICYRVWVGGTRLLAGFFTSLPTDTHNGAGYFWFQPGEITDTEGGPQGSEDESFSTGVGWGHTDPSNKTTELFFGGDLTSNPAIEIGRIWINQQGADEASPIKTVKQTSSLEGEELRYIGRWKEDEPFWSGKIDSNFGGNVVENSNICARLMTGEGVDEVNCLAIDTDSEEFLDPPSPEDFSLPDGFPEAPTF